MAFFDFSLWHWVNPICLHLSPPGMFVPGGIEHQRCSAVGPTMARWGNPRDYLRWPLRLSHEKLGKTDFTIFAYGSDMVQTAICGWHYIYIYISVNFIWLQSAWMSWSQQKGRFFEGGSPGAAILMLSSAPQLVSESCDMQVASWCSLILFGYVEYILRHLMNVRNKSKQWGQTLHGAAILHVPTFRGHRYVVHRPGATALPQLGVWVGMWTRQITSLLVHIRDVHLHRAAFWCSLRKIDDDVSYYGFLPVYLFDSQTSSWNSTAVFLFHLFHWSMKALEVPDGSGPSSLADLSAQAASLQKCSGEIFLASFSWKHIDDGNSTDRYSLRHLRHFEIREWPIYTAELVHFSISWSFHVELTFVCPQFSIIPCEGGKQNHLLAENDMYMYIYICCELL